MEYLKILNLLDSGAALNTSSQPSKFRTKNWVEITDESRAIYAVNKQIKFKTSMLIVYVVTLEHTYLLKEIYQLIILLVLVLLQVLLIKK